MGLLDIIGMGTPQADSGSYTPESIDTKRRLALAMLQAGQSDKLIASPLQGWNRVLQSMLGAKGVKDADKLDRSAKKEADEALLKALVPGYQGIANSTPNAVTASLAPTTMNDAAPGPAAPAMTPVSVGNVGAPDDVIDRLIGTESGGRADARNPNSSATGSGQFIDSTWLSMMKKHRPDLMGGKSNADLLALRTDPTISREMTAAYAKDNGALLQNAGFDVTPGNIKLAHFAGPQGALAVLRADPNTPVSRVLTSGAIDSNPFLRNMTAGQVRDWADKQMGGGERTAQAGPSAPATATDAAYIPPSSAQKLQTQAVALMQNPRTSELGRQLLLKAATAEAPKAPESVQEYMLGVQQGFKGTYRDWTIEQKQAGRTQINNSVGSGETAFAKGLNENLSKDFTTRRTGAQSAVQTINSLNDARGLLDSQAGVITGTGAEWKLAFGKALQQAGFNENADTIANTEAFGSQMANQVLSQIKTLGANPSNADREFMEKAAGGRITLNEQSIRKILDIGEKTARGQIKTFNTDAGQIDPKTSPFRLQVEEPETYTRGGKPSDQPKTVKTETISPISITVGQQARNPATNEVIQWDGTKWVPLAKPPAAPVGASSSTGSDFVGGGQY